MLRFQAFYRDAYGLLHEPSADARALEQRVAALDARLVELQRETQATWIHSVHWIAVLCLLGRFEQADAHAEALGAQADAVGSPGVHLCDFTFYRGLTAAVRGRRRSARACLGRLRAWARNGPGFAHMAELIEAELERARGRSTRALELYARAARGAAAQSFVQHAALAHERRAELFAATAQPLEAARALREATQLYALWEAHTRVRELKARRAELAPAPR